MNKKSYKELKDEAKSLGLRYTGVSQENLIKSIEEAKKSKVGDDANLPDKLPNVPAVSNVAPKELETPAKDDEEYNVAVVMNGKKEERRYTLESHGESFKKLAEEFAAKKKFTVSFQNEGPAMLCPHCGGKIYPKR